VKYFVSTYDPGMSRNANSQCVLLSLSEGTTDAF
jgi:hypothetical protein